MKKTVSFLALLVIVFLLSFLVHKSSSIPYMDYKIYNSLKKEINFSKPSSSVAVIEIDEQSLRVFGQWPWNRILTAKLVQEVLLSKPAAFGTDVMFIEKDRTSLKEIQKFYKVALGYDIKTDEIPENLQDSDKIFASALLAGNSVLATLVDDSSSLVECRDITSIQSKKSFEKLTKIKSVTCSYNLLNKSASANGFINANPKDGFLRDTNSFFSYKGQILPSLTMAMLLKVDPNLTLKSDDKNKGLVVNFLNKNIKLNESSQALNTIYPPSKFKRISASDILLGNADLKELSGKFVLFGATAMGLFDKFTGLDGKTSSGVYYHASFLENFLTNNLISQPTYYKNFNFYLGIIALIVIVFLLVKFEYLYAAVLFFISIAISLAWAYIKLEDNIYISIGYFIVPLTFVFLVLSLISSCLNFIQNKKFLQEIDEAHGATIDSMISVIEGKDLETGGHITRTREYARVLATYLYKKGFFKDIIDPKFIEILSGAVPLHDIGKVAIPNHILGKKGLLTDDEIKIMRTHVKHGKDIIQKATKVSNNKNMFLNAASNIAYTHHERWDGSGYPQGLKEYEIPLEGRLMALIDVYDALTSKRPYKEACSFEYAEEYIIQNSAKHFDPILVLAFTKVKNDFRKICTKYKD